MPRCLNVNFFTPSSSRKSHRAGSKPAKLTEADQELLNIRRQTAVMVCKEIQKMVLNNSSREGLVEIELEEVNKFLKAVTALGFDSSEIKSKIEKLNESIKKYKSIRASIIPNLATLESMVARVSSKRKVMLLDKEHLDEELNKLKRMQEMFEGHMERVDIKIKDYDAQIVHMKRDIAKMAVAPIAHNVPLRDAQTFQALKDCMEAQRREFEGSTL